jgi:beta-propeller uncharacterized protein DUF5122
MTAWGHGIRGLARSLTLAGLLLALVPAGARALPSDTPDQTAFQTNGTVRAVARGNGVTYIGGNFSALFRRTGGFAQFSPSSGRVGLASPQVEGGSAIVLGSAPDGAGGVFIGGDFTSVGGVARDNIAHVLADGSVDPSFNPDANQPVFALAVSGGAFFVGGDFSGANSIGGEDRDFIAKLSATSGNATTWNPDSNGRVQAIAVSGTDVYVGGGFFSNIGGESRNNIAKLSATTGLADPTWDPDASNAVKAIAVSGTQIFVGGSFNGVDSIGGEDRNRIAKLSATSGNAFSTWNPNAKSDVFALALDGTNLYVGGAFSGANSIGGQSRDRIAKLSTTSGNAFSTWNPSANGSVQSLAVSGSEVYAGGGFTNIGGLSRFTLAKLSATSGNAFSAFNPDPDSDVLTISVSGSSVYAGGFFSVVNRTFRDNIAAVDDNGVPTSFNPDANGLVRAIAVSGSDVYVGGDFLGANSIGGQNRNRIAKLSAASGNAFSGFNAGTVNDVVSAIAVSGSDVYVGGTFTSIGGQSRDQIAKLSATSGNAFSAWNPNVDGTGVNALAVSGSNVFVGGSFTAIGGESRDNIAKLSATSGNAFSGFDPGADNTVTALALDGSNLYAGGLFDNIGGQPRKSIARLSATSGNVSAWDPSALPEPNQVVNAIAISGNEVYAGGNFTTIGGLARNRLAALSATSGNAFSTFNPNVGATSVSSLAASGSDLYVGGFFTTVGGKPRQGYAQFTGP